jgi:aflatoxin B1 aldehyde reductase
MAAPRVILGLMTCGPPSSDTRITSPTDLAHHLDLFQHTFGHTELDTARIYAGGQQEKFAAQAGWKERGLSIATKSYPLSPGSHAPANIRKDLMTSLSELGTERVDIFYLHTADRSVPFAETLEEVNRMYCEGRFAKLGLSNFAAYELAEIVMLCAAKGWVRPSIYQGVYNALGQYPTSSLEQSDIGTRWLTVVVARNLETEIIPACRRYGLDVAIYTPLAGGLLTDRHDSDEGRYSSSSSLGPIFRALYFNEATFQAVDTIRRAATTHGLSMAEVALRWCVHHSALRPAHKGGNDGIVIGVSSIEQMEQNIADIRKGPLPEDVVEALEEAWRVARGSSQEPWHTPLVYTYDARKILFGSES